MLKNDIYTALKESVKSLYGLEIDTFVVEHPEEESWGDYASNIAMVLTKPLKQSPMQIAENISSRVVEFLPKSISGVSSSDIFEKVYVAKPGFINFVLAQNWLKNVLQTISTKNDNYGSSKIGEGKNVLIEYSQPNPNKPLHVGHSRNNFIGSSMCNIYSFCGYNVIKTNYMNDWGTHICKSMLMYKLHGDNKDPDEKSDHFVGKFYAMYDTEVTKDPSLNDQLLEMFKALEAGDPETTELWKRIVNWACDGWKKTYEDENVQFDLWMYQHDYKDTGKEIVKLAMDSGVASKDPSGAVIAHLEQYGIPDKVLLRSNGTSIYSTQDLQLAKDSFEKYSLDQRIYVVDVRQSDYFKQIFKILGILGFEWSKRLFHLSYGFVSTPEGSMSSRKGNVITADSVYENLISLETKLLAETGRADVSESDIKKIALAAFRYGMLKVDPSQDMVFDMDKVARFEGNTGPYILYSCARCSNVISKYDGVADSISDSYNYNVLEVGIIRLLEKFPEVVEESLLKLAPHVLAQYLFDVSQKFNSYYSQETIIDKENADISSSRVFLSKQVLRVLTNGCQLLGIKIAEKM